MPENKSLLFRSSLVFYLTLLVYFIASFFTGLRTWGIDFWGYYPLWVRICLLGICIIMSVLGYYKLFKYNEEIHEDRFSPNTFLWFSIGLVIISGLTFYFFRIKTHFLGDGYMIISLLADEVPLIKGREIGEAIIHVWFKNLFGLKGTDGAEISYQSLSIVAGIIFVISTLWFSHKYYDTFKYRIILTLGTLSGGYMLLFFGYVENYSFFVLSVSSFIYVSVLVLNRKISKYWVIPALGLAIFFHIFGVILIPGAIYAMTAGSHLGNRIKSISRPTLYLIGTLLVVGFCSLFFYFYSNYSFFYFAVIPILSNRFTAEGYTMLSINHLIDIFNLLIIMLPGIGLLVLFLISYFKERKKWNRDLILLIILSLSGLGAILIFDPKLGMPRDWDLFSLTGIPLTLLLFDLIIMKIKLGKKEFFVVAVLIIILGFQSIGARLGIINTPALAEQQFKNYLFLDHSKGRNAWLVLINYYEDKGDTLAENSTREEWKEKYPEKKIFGDAQILFESNKLDSSKILLEQVIAIDATFFDAWHFLGEYFLRRRIYDSAIYYTNIALGLNPFYTQSYNNLGMIYLYKGNYKEAEKYFLNALKFEPEKIQIAFNLAMVYKNTRNRELYEKYFKIAAQDSLAPIIVLKEYGDYCLSQMRYEEAAEVYQRALNIGLDTNHVINTMNKYPALKQYLKVLSGLVPPCGM